MRGVFAAAVFFACAAPAVAQEHPALAVPAYSSFMAGTWTYPDSATMAAEYPKAALKAGIAGTAVVDCAVAPEGTLHDCRIVSESPAEQGFAAATLKVAEAYIHVDPASIEGGVPVHARRRLALKWVTG